MFKRKFIKVTGLIASLLLLCLSVFAQAPVIDKSLYLAATIPDSLKENANSVVRYAADEITVKAAGRVTQKHYRLVTILNEKADHEAAIGVGYEKKYNTVGSVDIRVYNALGTLIKKYTKSDMYDRSAVDDMTIVTDDRYLYLTHVIASYPVTVEISYEYNINSYVALPTWNIQSPETAIQKAVYKVSINPALGFRYKYKNIKIDPQKSIVNNFETYTWQVANLKAEKTEEDVPAWRVTKKITFATNQFEFFGRPGDLTSWASYSKWQQGLNNDVNTLPEPRAEELRKMTADLVTDKEKAKFLYNYLQQSMRYVSIQLGIGGFKPFPATFVDQKKYGDCKALVNYMQAMLKAVNIPSYYAEVNAGTNGEPADLDFPNDPFNHIILCVPFKADTTWLECTSNTQPFGKLGPFTENRRALLVTDDGGKLVNTPRSSMENNTFNSNVHIILNADGGAKAKMKIQSTGEYRSLYVSLSASKVDDQKEYLIKHLNMKQPSTLSFNTAEDKDGIKELDIDLEYDRFYDVSAGEKRFYRPRVFDLWRVTIPMVEKRKSDFYFEHPMLKNCVTTIDLPVGFEPESLPANVNLKFTYGSYIVNYQYLTDKNQVISTTNFSLTNQQIPAARYNELQQYLDNIAKAQNKKLVIRHKAS